MKYKFTDSKESITPEEVGPIKIETKIIKKENSNHYQEKKGDKKLISEIDQKIDSVVNERILKLVQIGLKHELTIDNMFQYFREINKTKLYELKRYFSDAKLSDIDDMLQYLYKTGVLTRDSNNWYSLKSK